MFHAQANFLPNCSGRPPVGHSGYVHFSAKVEVTKALIGRKYVVSREADGQHDDEESHIGQSHRGQQVVRTIAHASTEQNEEIHSISNYTEHELHWKDVTENE